MDKYRSFLMTLFESYRPDNSRQSETELQHLVDKMRKEGTLASTLPGTNPDFISDHFFFRALGMRSVKLIDVDLSEGADYQANLNFAGSFSDELGREFDLLYDGGTLEHVFHLPNALANIHKVVKPGGHIIHFNPMNNDPDHGFYQFSPTFYHDYYQANDFKIVRMFIFRIAGNALHDPYMVMQYEPGSLDTAAAQIFGDGSMYYNGVFVQKLAHSTSDRVPEQSIFSRYK